MIGAHGESGTENRVGASCCLEGPGGFLEEVTSELRPGGGERFTQFFGDLRTGPYGWRDRHEVTRRW